MATKSIQRSIATLKGAGYTVGIVEKFNHFVKIRQDLYGFIDLIAFHPEKNEVLAIQACSNSGGDVSAHVNKLVVMDVVQKWVRQPMRRLEIWGWAKQGERGKRKLWTLRRVKVTPEFIKENLPADFDKQLVVTDTSQG